MSDNIPWAEQWLKAQQQFVNAWSDMASGSNSANQSDLWSQSFDMWRKACDGNTQPDIEMAMRKCMDMGKEYFAMAEQISKSGASDAADAMTKVVGASVVGGKFVYVRGLGDRYSNVNINGSPLPSSDPVTASTRGPERRPRIDVSISRRRSSGGIAASSSSVR